MLNNLTILNKISNFKIIIIITKIQKMKKLFLILSVATLMLSCGDASGEATADATEEVCEETTETTEEVSTEEVSE